MSTASWSIDRETAKIIMPDGRDSFDMNRAWKPNGAMFSANQYEWCHVFDGGIECAKCGIEHIIKGDDAFHDRKVTTEPMIGCSVEALEFATYEFTEVVVCECGETLGGWEETCDYCMGHCDCYTYDLDNSEKNLAGYTWGGRQLLTFDDIPPDDIREDLRPICENCLFYLFYMQDEETENLAYMGENRSTKITMKEMYEAEVKVSIEFDIEVTSTGRSEEEIVGVTKDRIQAMDFDQLIRLLELASDFHLHGYGVRITELSSELRSIEGD